MFAIPAFQSLSSSSLKSNFEQSPAVVNSVVLSVGTKPNDNNPASPHPRNRKRKRSELVETPAVNEISANDLGDLWNRYVEKKSSSYINGAKASGEEASQSKKDKKRKRSRKKEKTVEDGESEVIRESAAATDSQSAALDVPLSGVVESSEGKLNGSNQQTSKEKSKKKRKQKEEIQENSIEDYTRPVKPAPSVTSVNIPSVQQPKLTPLQEKMRLKLSSARFRHLNELLYTKPSSESSSLFLNQPEMFTDYHSGFRQQVETWPENPVDIFLQRLFARGKLRENKYKNGKVSSNGIATGANSDVPELAPLPRGKDGIATIIDLGCGEAAIAKAITNAKPRPKLKIHSYDLQAPNPLVTIADIANLPLKNGSVDVAIFCLALMGTNWLQMIEEAIRVIRTGGEVWIAEIKSRFARTKGIDKEKASKEDDKGGKGRKKGAKPVKDDTKPGDAFVEEREDDEEAQNRWAEGEQRFIDALSRRGLRLKNRNGKNKMFVLLDFEKVGGRSSQGFVIPPKPDMYGRISKKFHDRDDATDPDEGNILQPCLYKLR